MAHLQQELRKTHKKLNSICMKESSDLMETITPEEEKPKRQADVETQLNQVSLDQSRNDGRTFSRGSCSPKGVIKRGNVVGGRKVSLPLHHQTYFKGERKVRPSTKKQLDFSPDSEVKDNSIKKANPISKEELQPTFVDNFDKNGLQVFIQSRLTGYKKHTNGFGSEQKLKQSVVRQSLEQRKDSIMNKATNHLELARTSIKKPQQAFSLGKDTSKSLIKCTEHAGDTIEGRKGPSKAPPILVHQHTSESLLSNPIALHGAGSPVPKDKPVTFDHRLNNKFKMIDYFEHDEKLVSTKKEYRVGLRDLGKNQRIQKSH